MYHKFKVGIGIVLTLIMTISLMGRIDARADSSSDFVSQMSPVVVTVAKKYNLYPSLMLAQAALESSYGQSSLATQGYNYFGIKGSYNGQSITLKTAEYNSSGSIYYTNASFKKYPNAQASLDDYAQLIRNGLVGASNFYSGTWKENTKSVNDAATALVGKYATDPNYANKLISIINQYNLTNLDNGITEQSNTVANGQANSASSNASSSSSTTTTTTSSSDSAATSNSSNNVKVSYYLGDGDEQVALSGSFRKQGLFSKIQGTTSNVKNYNWKASLKSGSPVYVDNVGYATGSTGKQTWYRIRFAKSRTAKKYWVKSQALSFPSVKYLKLSTSVDSGLLSKKVAYNHIYGSSTLASKINDPEIANRVKYNINMIALSGSKNDAEVWMRYSLDNGSNAWVKIKHVNGIQMLPVSITRKISSQYSQYTLYSNPPQKGVNQSAIAWNTVPAAQISKVKVSSLAVDAYDKTVWANIQIGNQKYWINNNALY
ncbi:glycoside hydrolase family 73 protein [Nicoliella lavandulae]|uniref:Glycoside hydrolase family 73 protein n=1 Tax=Nicoliella lavandulae TaxID=3082954 RepID=A0ABU8SK56_9LACO